MCVLSQSQADFFHRPFNFRRSSTRWPPLLRSRDRKPCRRFRMMTLGWYSRLTSSITAGWPSLLTSCTSSSLQSGLISGAGCRRCTSPKLPLRPAGRCHKASQCSRLCCGSLEIWKNMQQTLPLFSMPEVPMKLNKPPAEQVQLTARGWLEQSRCDRWPQAVNAAKSPQEAGAGGRQNHGLPTWLLQRPHAAAAGIRLLPSAGSACS